MEDIITKSITIGQHIVKEFPDNKVHNIVDADGKTKFQFYENKKEGGTTKAWQQWQDFELKAGIKVAAGVKEIPKSFKNADGKEIQYKQRTIVYFETDGEGAVNTQEVKTPQVDKAWKDEVDKRLTDLEFEVFTPKGAKEEINTDDLPF